MRTSGLAWLVLGIGVALGLAVWERLDSPFVPTARAADEVVSDTGFKGLGRCSGCHKEPSDFYKKETDVTDYVALTEYTTWTTKDKHKLAYKNLESDLGKRMGQLLGYDVTQSQQCLSCHANWRTKDPKPQERDLRAGVSCESCHGPSKLWDEPHSSEKWRTTPIDEKEKLGMIDVRDPVKRAKQCMSCHIGNAQEGKVLTHNMYAAGHPPLPSFEIETFALHMPPHWRHLNQKPKLKNRDQIAAASGYPPSDVPGAKAVIMGSVLALRESVYLAAAEAQGASDANPWPDLAQFDCSACHHDLRSPSWRQVRGYGSSPGRPLLRVWPSALVDVALHRAVTRQKTYETLRQELGERLAALNKVFERSPFGDPRSIGSPDDPKSPAGALVAWLDQLTASLSKLNYDQATVKGALRDLVQSAVKSVPDHESARQIAWAFRALYDGLMTKPQADQRIEAELAALDDELRLSLPWTQDRKILEELVVSLKTSGDYDPDKFRAHFQALKKIVLPDRAVSKP